MPATQPPRTRLDPAIRRELILDAAERVMADRLPQTVTFEEIADAAEVSRGLVYNYFHDRTGVLVALAERVVARLDQEIDAALEPGTDVGEQIVALGRAYRRHASTNADAWAVLSRSGLLDHLTVQRARAARVARIATRWGDTAEARLAAWTVTAVFEVTGIYPLPGPEDTDDLIRFARDRLAPVLSSSLPPEGR